MADMSFDVVSVGAGSKALVAAMYLTKYGGLSVGMFEEAHEAGGGWQADESAAPGHITHHHSHMHDTQYFHRLIFEDFPEWKDYGADYAHHDITHSAVFEDDTWIGMYNPHFYKDHLERTHKLWSRFSEKDADAFVWLWDKVENYIRPATEEFCYNPPKPLGEPDALELLYKNPDTGIDPLWLTMSPAEMMIDFFESPQAQCWGLRCIQSAGVAPDVHGFGTLLLETLSFWCNHGCVKGGNHQLAHACQRIICENGGKIFTRKLVDKIIVKNGKATGVKLADGTEIEAKKAVISGADPYQLVFRLLGEEYFTEKALKRIKNLQRDYAVISWYTWALHEMPEYKAAKFDPEISKAGWLGLAKKDVQYLLNESYSRRMGQWPSEHMNLIVSPHSIIDPRYAPEGKHTALTEQFVLASHYFSEAEWKKIEKTHAEEILNHWQKYAPNMTWDNIIGYEPVTPYHTARSRRNFGPTGNWNVIDSIPAQIGKFRPCPELARFQEIIPNIYCVGVGWHPYGGAQSYQGYWNYKLMAEAFGLRKPWEEKGRPY